MTESKIRKRGRKVEVQWFLDGMTNKKNIIK
jgi:hypothetical protein